MVPETGEVGGKCQQFGPFRRVQGQRLFLRAWLATRSLKPRNVLKTLIPAPFEVHQQQVDFSGSIASYPAFAARSAFILRMLQHELRFGQSNAVLFCSTIVNSLSSASSRASGDNNLRTSAETAVSIRILRQNEITRGDSNTVADLIAAHV